jgi:hypothetical protein
MGRIDMYIYISKLGRIVHGVPLPETGTSKVMAGIVVTNPHPRWNSRHSR